MGSMEQHERAIELHAQQDKQQLIGFKVNISLDHQREQSQNKCYNRRYPTLDRLIPVT